MKPPRLDLNPSSADRWTTCTASPGFILENAHRLPVEDRTFTDPGTTAHEVAAACLQNREPDPARCPVPIDADMRWHGWNYAEFVNGLGQQTWLAVENKIPLHYMPGRNAIVDAAMFTDARLHIVDYKYGEGVLVSAENNLQAIIYAKALMLHKKLTLPHWYPVFIHIYQPRARDAGESPVHTWDTTAGEINRLAEEIALTATKILLHQKNPKAEVVFAPSEKACRWCPAKGFCAARQEELVKDIQVLATIDPAPKHFPPVCSISVRQFSAILKHKDQIIKWLNDAEEYALQHMKSGGQIPGFKLVTSRGGNRYWSNPKAAAAHLLKTILKREEVIEEKVISPGAAEKLLGKNKFSVELTNLIARPPGRPVIAPDDDARESAFVNALTEFTNLDDF